MFSTALRKLDFSLHMSKINDILTVHMKYLSFHFLLIEWILINFSENIN